VGASFLLVVGFYCALPYAFGLIAGHVREQNWGRALGWGFLFLFLLLVSFLLLGFGISDFGTWQWHLLMVLEMVLWWGLWFHHYSRNNDTVWRTTALFAFLFSTFLALAGPTLIVEASAATDGETAGWQGLVGALVLLVLLVASRLNRGVPGSQSIRPPSSPRPMSDQANAARLGCVPYPSAERSEEHTSELQSLS
jgi:hypothetical protein